MCCILAVSARNNPGGLFQWIYKEHTKSDGANQAYCDFRKGVEFTALSHFYLQLALRSL